MNKVPFMYRLMTYAVCLRCAFRGIRTFQKAFASGEIQLGDEAIVNYEVNIDYASGSEAKASHIHIYEERDYEIH